MHESQFAHLVLQTASYSKVHSTVTWLLFFIAILSFFFVCGLECGAVGVEDRNKIPDARMTASTYFDSDFYPYYGRLNENRGDGAWCAETTTNRTDYLQVDIGAVHSVCAVATQGERVGPYWTTSYIVHFSLDGVTWNNYTENNVQKVTRIMNTLLSRSGVL